MQLLNYNPPGAAVAAETFHGVTSTTERKRDSSKSSRERMETRDHGWITSSDSMYARRFGEISTGPSSLANIRESSGFREGNRVDWLASEVLCCCLDEHTMFSGKLESFERVIPGSDRTIGNGRGGSRTSKENNRVGTPFSIIGQRQETVERGKSRVEIQRRHADSIGFPAATAISRGIMKRGRPKLEERLISCEGGSCSSSRTHFGHD